MNATTSASGTPTRARPAVTTLSEPAATAAIAAAARLLHLPTIGAQAGALADAAARERLTHRGYLAEVLTAECDDREDRRKIRRVLEAKFPRTKRLEDFDTSAIADLPPATLAHLATGGWIDAGQPLVLLGDSGTGKTHLLIALGTAAAEQGRRVRYVTCAALVNELVEAADDKQLSRVVGRYARLDLLWTRSATSDWIPAAPSCSSRSSPPARNARRSPAPRTLRSPSGARPSPTPAWPPRSSTA